MPFFCKLFIYSSLCWQLFSIKELLILVPLFYLLFNTLQDYIANSEFTIKKSLIQCTLICMLLVIVIYREYWGYQIYTATYWYVDVSNFKYLTGAFFTMVLFNIFAPLLSYTPCDIEFLRFLKISDTFNTIPTLLVYLKWQLQGCPLTIENFKLPPISQFSRSPIRDLPQKHYLYDSRLTEMHLDFCPEVPEISHKVVLPNYGIHILSNSFDSLNLVFITLVAFLSPLCVLWLWQDTSKINQQIFLFLFFFLLLGMLGAFSSIDFFFFFFFFECLLIPMFIILGTYGSRFRRLKASYYLVYYTLVGSALLFTAICLLISEYGTTHLIPLQDICINNKKQSLLWLLLFFGFSVKIPIFPVHIWLPEAHVEAPTIGSVILAAFILKLGGYGLIRWVFSIFTYGSYYFMPLVAILSLLGVNYCALTALRQIDLKKMIAYSSVSHMNLGILGIFSFSFQGLQGALFLMIAHGITSAGLFFLIGALYDRYHSKALHYFGGLATVLPLLSTFLVLFSIANFSFPGSPNFIGEVLILLGILKNSILLFFFSCFGVFLSTCFSILLVNKLVFGTLKSTCKKKTQDLNRREFFVLSFLIFYGLALGLWPQPFLDLTTFYCKITTIKTLI